MIFLDKIEQVIGCEHLSDFEQSDAELLSLTDTKELPTHFLAQPHANSICYIAD